LRGRAEIAKHLRAAFGQGATHHVEGEDVVDEGRVTFREVCEYPDGSRVWVETTLELRDGKIVRQVDVVARADRRAENSGRPSPRKIHPDTQQGMDEPQTDWLLRSKQATEKEDLE